ncbi:MAG: ABC transporter permease [Campylobacteraceae bacterium]|jgi:peptide/nickel transport system permease protein|nr:ABC transporter permease [Campylobacteraceae bacterium]
MKKAPIASFTILAFIILLSFLGGFIYPLSPYDMSSKELLQAPNFSHILGTDRLGRDILARIIEGGKVSLFIGFCSAVIASFAGLVIGISAGFFAKNTDKIIVIIIDLFLTFPTFFLLLALISYINASALTLVIVISVTGWMSMARLIRSESFAINSQPFIKVLRLAHVSKLKIIFKYFAPLLAPIFFISFTFSLSGAILAESGLSFLGIGVMPPDISWGSIISEGKEVIDVAWWVSFFPGLMIFLVTFSLINISDYLQFLTNQKETQKE